MAATNSMTNYLTTFESTQNLVKTIEIGHGENADLVANFTDNGIPVSLSGFTARALFQPKSEWGTDNWYECPCEISEDTTIAHWSNDSDNGDNAVKLFMYLLKDGKVAYPAIYRIGLFETPGHTPGSIIPIQKTLDFSEYNLVNAPWALSSDIAYNVRSIEASDASSSEHPFQANTNEVLGITVPSNYSGSELYVALPTGGIEKAVDFYITIQNKKADSITLSPAVEPWPEDYGMACWELVTDEGKHPVTNGTFIVDAGITVTIHFFENGTRGTGSSHLLYVSRAGHEVTRIDADISAIETNVSALSASVNSISSDVSTLSGNVGTLSSNVSTLSGKVGTIQTSLSATQKLIFDGFSGGSTLYPHYTLAVQNRQINGINVSQYYQSELNIRLPEYTPTNAIYAILDVNNTNGNTSGWYLRFVQPTLGTWKIMMDANTTMNELTAVPQHSYVRYYICQWGAALEGGSTGNEWGALHIRKEVLQLTTI